MYRYQQISDGLPTERVLGAQERSVPRDRHADQDVTEQP